MKKLLVLGLAVALAACGTQPHYLKPETTRQDFTRDYDDCFWQASPPLYLSIPVALLLPPAVFLITAGRDAKVHDCMAGRGYSVGDASGYTR